MSQVPEQSPGATAYAAYWPALGSPPPVPWTGLSPVVQAAWEAAAQAVLTQAVADTLAIQRQLAAAVRTVPPPEEPPHG